MGVDTHGWIEVAEVIGDHMRWVGVIKITPYVFPGLGRGQLRYRFYGEADHGPPEDLSDEARHDVSRGVMSPASILWVKIEQEKVDLWDIDPIEDRWWWELRDMVEILLHDYKAEHIRFVFWGI